MKDAYTAPTVEQWGTVRELTLTGKTTEGGDAKTGSVASQGV